MNHLHLSTKTYARGWGHFGEHVVSFTDTPMPLCGANDGIATIRRGTGVALVSDSAISGEFHCPECVKIARSQHA